MIIRNNSIEIDADIVSVGEFAKLANISSDQTIDGVKTFSSSPIVPTPTTDIHVANKGYIDTEMSQRLNALAPHSGLLQDRKDFYFNTTASYLCKVSVQDKYMKVGDKVVEMYGPELVTNGDFSNGTTGWTSTTGSFSIVDEYMSIGNSDTDTRVFSTDNVFTQGETYSLSIYVKDINLIASAVQFGTGETILHTNGAGYGELKKGLNTVTFVAPETTTLRLYSWREGFDVDNISVREVKTIDLNTTNSRTGFYGSTSNSFVPEVLVQDQAVNGLNVTSGVKKGDYVVVKKQELVTNGTFDTDLSGWTGSGATLSSDTTYYTNGGLRVALTADNGRVYQTINCTVGMKYTIKYSLHTESGDAKMLVGGSPSNGSYLTDTNDTGTGVRTSSFIAGANTVYISLQGSYSGSVVYFDNISVQLADDTYRAIQDTPSGTSLTNTTYFQTRDYISNQILTMLKADGTLYSEVLINDVYAEDIGSDRVFTSNGWSKVGHGLWSKGSVVGTPIGIWQTLNKGAYHPWFNSMGTQKITDDSNLNYYDWYETNAHSIISVAENFANLGTYSIPNKNYSNTVSGHTWWFANPQDKAYDIIYQDQWIDLRTYATKQNHNLDVLANKAVSAELSGISNEVGFSQNLIGINVITKTGDCSVDIHASYGWDGYRLKLASTGSNRGDATPYFYTDPKIAYGKNYVCLMVGDNGNTKLINGINHINYNGAYTYFVPLEPYEDRGIVNTEINTLFPNGTVITVYSFNMYNQPILSSKTKLSTGLIGNPSNYPQSLKDMLASGKVVVGINPLLVGQDGTSYINNVTSVILSNKNTFSIGSTNNLVGFNTIDGELVLGDSTTLEGSTNRISNVLGFNSTWANYHIKLGFYTSANPIFNTSTPLKVKQVGNKAIASNSHSIYKGNLLSDCGVQVGNGTNGLESKVLEDVLIDGSPHYDHKTTSGTFTFNVGERILVDTIGVPSYGIIFENIDANYTLDWNEYAVNFSESAQWKKTGAITTPKHNTLTLDTSVSKASKHFFSIVEDTDGNEYLGKFSMELKNDGDWGETTFPQLTNGTYAGENGTLKTSFSILPLGTKGE